MSEIWTPDQGLFVPEEGFDTLRAGSFRTGEEVDRENDLLFASQADALLRASNLPPGARPSEIRHGEDYSANNAGTLDHLIDKNDRFVMLRVTGGLGFPRTDNVWMDSRFKEWERQIRRDRYDKIVKMFYGFPITARVAKMADQVRRFVRTPDSWKNRIPVVDYELYGPKPSVTCRPQDLEAYVKGIWRAIGLRHIVIYAGINFWKAAPFTGTLKGLFGDKAKYVHMMNAWYFSMREIQNAHQFYADNVARSEWWGSYYKGLIPELCQIGIGAGNQDQNVTRVGLDVMRRWAASGRQN